MGIFNFFKSKHKKDIKVFTDDFQKKAFPNGILQIKKEVNEIIKLLDFKYNFEQTEDIYIHAVSVYYISKLEEKNAVVFSISNHITNKVTNEDALKIYEYLRLKFSNDIVKIIEDKSSKTMLFSMFCKGGIVELKRAYKELNDVGKFEVIIFNAVIVLNTYQNKYGGDNSQIQSDFMDELIKSGKTYLLNSSNNEILTLLNKRFEFYLEKMTNIYALEQSTIWDLHFIFYPTNNLVKFFNIDDQERFKTGISNMIVWVENNTKKL